MSPGDRQLDRLAAGRPPHLHSGLSPGRVSRDFLIASAPVVAASVVLFGGAALGVMLFAVLGALAADGLVVFVAPERRHRSWGSAMVIGLLLAFTLPATAGWHVAFLGGLIAVAVGRAFQGGFGNYLWHPALVGWAVLQLLIGAQLVPQRLPVLARGHLLSGSISTAVDVPYYRGYELTRPPAGVEAWALRRPVDRLTSCCGSLLVRRGDVPSQGLPLFRDHLPPWRDTLWGTVGGTVGETCTFALILSGLYLVYRGFLRRRCVAAAFLTVAVLAAVLPIKLDGEFRWFPLLAVHDGFPMGMAWVLFHLTGGGLVLSCLMMAADPMTTPLTARGHTLFGVGLGAVTMAARWIGLVPGSSFWAVLVMNTLVPLIDRTTRPRGRHA